VTPDPPLSTLEKLRVVVGNSTGKKPSLLLKNTNKFDEKLSLLDRPHLSMCLFVRFEMD
jgi:hypothetical protein